MQKKEERLRRLIFFDRQVVQQEGSDAHPGIQRLNVACARGSPQHLWLGERSGELHRLDRNFTLSSPVQAFDRELIDLRVLEQRSLLVALGSDAPKRGEGPSNANAVKYKIFDYARCNVGAATSSEPLVLRHSHLIFPRKAPAELQASCFDAGPAASSTFSLLAVGASSGVVYLFRGRDLANERPYAQVLADEDEPSVTAVHFLEQPKRTVLFVCTMVSWPLIIYMRSSARRYH
eukprot:gnl/TRDRNA2_/TRDRNA2_170967_c1_seq2.p1 gnl/TRDRNA2_/TRDRNA2_170967_c1~~gnl/TRDRNA2_/TRDRNA2_170967_c1_seq2.p1  ORF type:complete len:234 (-),score=34.17 gnl/TRDRNA2_/TRDRNA2_170967_c1_seq2:145-846(-)